MMISNTDLKNGYLQLQMVEQLTQVSDLSRKLFKERDRQTLEVRYLLTSDFD